MHPLHFSGEDAERSIIYSYKYSLLGFSAILSSTQAATLASNELSVFFFFFRLAMFQFNVGDNLNLHIYRKNKDLSTKTCKYVRSGVNFQEQVITVTHNKKLGLLGPYPGQ